MKLLILANITIFFATAVTQTSYAQNSTLPIAEDSSFVLLGHNGLALKVTAPLANRSMAEGGTAYDAPDVTFELTSPLKDDCGISLVVGSAKTDGTFDGWDSRGVEMSRIKPRTYFLHLTPPPQFPGESGLGEVASVDLSGQNTTIFKKRIEVAVCGVGVTDSFVVDVYHHKQIK